MEMPRLALDTSSLDLTSAFPGGCRASEVCWRTAGARGLCARLCEGEIWSPSCFEGHTRPCRKVLTLVPSTRRGPVCAVNARATLPTLVWARPEASLSLGCELGVMCRPASAEKSLFLVIISALTHRAPSVFREVKCPCPWWQSQGRSQGW